MRWLALALRDSRYIRVDDKPLLLVYRVSRSPNPEQTASIWREEALKLGLGDIFLAAVESLREDRVDPTRIGFDAPVEFQPDWLNLGNPLSTFSDGNFVYSYPSLVEAALARPVSPFRRFRCVTTGWDNTPRRRRDACVFSGSTPELYRRWLDGVIDTSPSTSGPPTVFVNAWNEWAEGAHLEPGRHSSRRYLEATREALNAARPRVEVPPTPAANGQPVKVSVCIPSHNGADFLPQAIESVLAQTFTDFELVVVDDSSDDASVAIARSFDDPRLRLHANPARLGLVGNWNRCVELARGEYIYLFHQDDVMEPDNLARKSSFLDEHPSAGFVTPMFFRSALAVN